MNRIVGPLIAATLSAALPASAQVVLKVADSFPTSHYISINGAKKFMDEATRLSGGKVTFEYFPTQQLGKAKDMLPLTLSGVTDIGYIVSSYAPDKLPLSGVVELPGMFSTSCEGTAAYMKLARDGYLYEHEFKPNGVKPLMAFALGAYQVFTKSAPIHKLDDLKGLKIRASGGAFEPSLRTLGAIPVRMAAPEIRESLMRGTIDGSVGPYVSAKPYGLDTVVKFGTVGASFGSFSATYSISQKKWDSLPPDIQKALSDAGDIATKWLCSVVDKQESGATADIEAMGAKLWYLNAAEKADLRKQLAPVHEEWVKRLDERNLPGSGTLEAWHKASGS